MVAVIVASIVKSPIPAVYAPYEGDAIDWPAERTTAGYCDRATIERNRVAALALKARYDAQKAASEGCR